MTHTTVDVFPVEDIKAVYWKKSPTGNRPYGQIEIGDLMICIHHEGADDLMRGLALSILEALAKGELRDEQERYKKRKEAKQ